MNLPLLRRLAGALLAIVIGLAPAWALADPPSRVARLSYVTGPASFSPGGERDWARAIVNRPLITGDRLWVDRGARAELQLGVAAVRVGAFTNISLLNLDDRVTQIELSQGVLNIRVRRLDRGEVFEVDTPNLAFSIRRPGSYRVAVDPRDGFTTVTVRSGLAEVYGEGRAFVVTERQTYRFFDTSLRDYETFAQWRVDDFDRWSAERDRRWDNSPSRRFVSAELIGYEDLDSYGTWRRVPQYGNVWIPSRVPAGWAPYRDGHWAWVEPWGWTWIDDAPWGFAPSHYGRWTYLDRSWAWVPGPVNVRPVYAPALVAFVGGVGSGQAPGGAIGWFPLGPREVYRPSYTVSREYFTRVNVSNAVVNRDEVATWYNGGPRQVRYANQQVPGAVIAVLAAAFTQSRPVARETVRLGDAAARAPAAAVAPVAPARTSVIGAAPSSARPPEETRSRPVVAQVKPPPPPAPFESRQGALAANVGKPHDTAAITAARPAAPAPDTAPAVKVVESAKPVAPPARPARGAGRAGADTATQPAPQTPPGLTQAPDAGRTPGQPPRASGTPAPAETASPRAGDPQPGRPTLTPPRSPAAQPAPPARDAAPTPQPPGRGPRADEGGPRGEGRGPDERGRRARQESAPAPAAAPAPVPAPTQPAPTQPAPPQPAAPPPARAPAPERARGPERAPAPPAAPAAAPAPAPAAPPARPPQQTPRQSEPPPPQAAPADTQPRRGRPAAPAAENRPAAPPAAAAPATAATPPAVTPPAAPPAAAPATPATPPPRARATPRAAPPEPAAPAAPAAAPATPGGPPAAAPPEARGQRGRSEDAGGPGRRRAENQEGGPPGRRQAASEAERGSEVERGERRQRP